jgi:simple sugar transport system permease protein
VPDEVHGGSTEAPAVLRGRQADPTPTHDRARALLGRALRRPELSPLGGAVAVFLLFSFLGGASGFLSREGLINCLEVAAELGIITVAVTLLAIAGEFDLSVGSMLGASGVLIGLLVAEAGWPLAVTLPCAVVFAMIVGGINGYLVIKTGLPSFIVTLAALFILRGGTIAGTHAATGGATAVSGIEDATAGDPLKPLFAGHLLGLPASVWWWFALVALGTWVLVKTGFGNWIIGAGGDAESARKLGVPVARVKQILFVATALCATLVATISVLANGAADVQQGQLKEFEAITATVIGGTLLTGGYGTVVGGALGALIFGIVNQGIFFTNIDSDWYQAVLGGLLLAAVLINRWIHRRARER